MTGCYPPRVGFGGFHGEVALFPGHGIGRSQEEVTCLRN
jgi:arylsulfatase A